MQNKPITPNNEVTSMALLPLANRQSRYVVKHGSRQVHYMWYSLHKDLITGQLMHLYKSKYLIARDKLLSQLHKSIYKSMCLWAT